ncbi:AB-hydrolase YheT [Calocera viscosa TUFC12733]|uniref:AB-hydrolase YheT n=1 Tax=Calocera viscosa (strain TUFC12733) TaxID=1330018 RepID=A0A167HJA5_CALVF|nr:AB-hydrolase YheT [Calocera viscosa TUFC12733]
MGALLSFLFAMRKPTLWYPDAPAYIDILPSPTIEHANGAASNGVAQNGVDKAGKAGLEKVSVRAFVERKVPELQEAFNPTWFLPGGHLQTIYCVIGDFTKVNPIHYTRKILTFTDGGSIAVDLAGAPDLPPTTPIVVVCHGLAGGSHESYVRDTLNPIVAGKEDGGMGWRGMVCNFRGCGGSTLTSSQLYSAGNTDDLRAALLYLTTRFPDAPLVGIGFSLGACVLTRYLGEEGEHSRLKAGMVLGCPWDLVKNGKRLEENWFIRNTYSKAMGANLSAVVNKHLSSIVSHPLGQSVEKDLSTLFKIRAPTLKTVDTYVTRHLGGPQPPFPFPSADAYYEWASCHKSILNIRVPFLAINADDDPIIVGNMLPVEEVKQSPWCVLGVTRGGGHLGWWIRGPILQYLRACIEDYVPPTDRTAPGWERKNGFIYQIGDRNDIGFHEEAGVEDIEGAEGEATGIFAGL